MNTVRVRTIVPAERRQLHRLKRQATNQVMSVHARIILLSSGGVGNRDIAGGFLAFVKAIADLDTPRSNCMAIAS
jgi:hypothetical protein